MQREGRDWCRVEYIIKHSGGWMGRQAAWVQQATYSARPGICCCRRRLFRVRPLTTCPHPSAHIPPPNPPIRRVLHRVCLRRQASGAGQGPLQGARLQSAADAAVPEPGGDSGGVGGGAPACGARPRRGGAAGGQGALLPCPWPRLARRCSLRRPCPPLPHPLPTLTQVELPRVKTVVYWGTPTGAAAQALEVRAPEQCATTGAGIGCPGAQRSQAAGSSGPQGEPVAPTAH